MKKRIYLLGIVFALMTAGCSSSDDTEEMPDPVDDNPMTALTYEGSIRSIINSNCTSCHSNPPTNGAPMSLTTFNEVRDAVENRGLLGRINSSSNPMPPTGLLPSSTRQLIEDWIDLGMPEN